MIKYVITDNKCLIPNHTTGLILTGTSLFYLEISKNSCQCSSFDLNWYLAHNAIESACIMQSNNYFLALSATSHRKDSRHSSARRDSHLSSHDTTAVDGFAESGNGVHHRRGKCSHAVIYLECY